VPRSAEEQARSTPRWSICSSSASPSTSVLGLKVDSCARRRARRASRCGPNSSATTAYGRLHGGVISATLDAMGGLALMVGIAERHPHDNALQVLQRFSKMGTIDLRIDFLRQGLGQHFIAGAEVTRLGGRVGSTQMRLVNDEGTLIATGRPPYIVS
jgi:uncharacterized protein (TIGR00369 family)